MLRRTLFISAALALGACAGTPQLAVAPDVAAPARFTALPEATAAAEADWIVSLGDDALPALVAEALANNPDLLAAAANYDAARASARAAGAARLPALDGGLIAQGLEGSSQLYNLGLDASWTADVWGRLSDQARAGALNAEAAQADLHGARLAIAGATARSWFALTEARLQTDLARRDTETRARQLDIVDRRFARGVARSSDVRTARSALASAEAALASRIAAERATARALETLLGRYPAAETQSAETLPALSALPAPGDPAPLLARRPDIVAAERSLAAAGFSAEAARKALYPSLSFQGSVGNVATDISDLFSTASLAESLTASITGPIFRGGALRAERDRTEALARIQAAQYVNTVLSAFEEAENAIYADQRLAERVGALEEARAEAEAALGLVERQYAQGVATIFELIDAQSRLIVAEGQLISARRDRLDNRVALHLSIAGDFAAGGGITGAGVQDV